MTSKEFCVKCGSEFSDRNNFCTKCGYPREKQDELEKNENKPYRNIFTILGIFGFIIITTGLIFFAPAFVWSYLILGLFMTVIGGIVIYVGIRLRRIRKSYFLCDYCHYIAETQRELHNHSLLCKKRN